MVTTTQRRYPAPQLKLIRPTATGYNNVAIDTARRTGHRRQSNVVGYATDSGSTCIRADACASHAPVRPHRCGQARRLEQQPAVLSARLPGARDCAALTLGIIGHGELGQGVARIAEAFGMRVLVSQRPGREVSSGRHPLEQVLREST